MKETIRDETPYAVKIACTVGSGGKGGDYLKGLSVTIIENIYKVIDPLFIDDLREEFSVVKDLARNHKKKFARLPRETLRN